jgi:3-oxoacyl-[acyl-carrier protein] reductase
MGVDMTKLAGKVAIVTGAGRGIGQAIALKLASEGARVVVNDLDAEPARDTVAAIGSSGGEAVACVGNVTHADFATRFVRTAIDSFGGIDVIINNAGFPWDNVIQKMTDEQWHAIIDVHLTAPFRILREAAEFIRAAAKQEAAAGKEVFRKVINISSISGVCGIPGQVNYSAAKAGVIGMTKASLIDFPAPFMTTLTTSRLEFEKSLNGTLTPRNVNCCSRSSQMIHGSVVSDLNSRQMPSSSDRAIVFS